MERDLTAKETWGRTGEQRECPVTQTADILAVKQREVSQGLEIRESGSKAQREEKRLQIKYCSKKKFLIKINKYIQLDFKNWFFHSLSTEFLLKDKENEDSY